MTLKTLGNRQLGARESIENQLDGLANLIRASRLLRNFPEYLTSYIKDAQAAYSELTDEIHRFVTSFDIKYGMASNIEYKAKVLALLDELGVSPHDRATILATILSDIVSEVAAAAQRLPSEILQRSPSTKPPSGRPADKSAPDASMPAEARALFGAPPPPPPPVSRPAKYTKSNFPLDWLDNQNIVRAARRVTTEYKARDKSIPVPLDEVERVRAAFRLVRAYERRQQRMRAQPLANDLNGSKTERPGPLKFESSSATLPSSRTGQFENARHLATGRTRKERSLPALPDGITWPTETYSASPEARRGGGGIVAYLDRVWLPLLKMAPGAVDLRTLREVDSSAAMGVNNHKRGGKELPSHLHMPTERELNDRALAAFDNPSERPARLDWIARNRARQTKISQ